MHFLEKRKGGIVVVKARAPGELQAALRRPGEFEGDAGEVTEIRAGQALCRGGKDVRIDDGTHAGLLLVRRCGGCVATSWVRPAEQTVDGLCTAIGRLVDVFTPQECADCFAAAGYEPD